MNPKTYSDFLAIFVLWGQFLEAKADPTCFNDGSAGASPSSCTCLPGFAGADCSLVQCGANPFNLSRPVTGFGSSISDCTCDAGWTGLGCNVCTSPISCDTSFRAAGGQYPTGTSVDSNITLACNSSPVVVNSGSASCNVNDSTISSEFGGQTSVTFQRIQIPFRRPTESEGGQNASSTLALGIWNDGIEQISCSAGPCTSFRNLDSSHLFERWDCQNISCACLPGAAFCGTPTKGSSEVQNTSGFVEGVSGAASVICPPEESDDTNYPAVSTCAISSIGLWSLFNISEPILLSNCAFVSSSEAAKGRAFCNVLTVAAVLVVSTVLQ
ncbi:hypothetical protein SCHPADRAFT_123302 [Schizopora paradoxa]|uniref:EGF-like domain-containing protein n=1 Tax=Schizopora paradoxa TaxID=27342 RepID=A0A0H2S2Z7_9AGAM|nr:hypothetical protein SCHPADRAFT_123302 [Schizopora paradoxa]